MVVASQILWSGHRVPILRSHVRQEEPLDASEVVELPDRSMDGFSGVRTCFTFLKIGLRFGNYNSSSLQVFEVNEDRFNGKGIFFTFSFWLIVFISSMLVFCLKVVYS